MQRGRYAAALPLLERAVPALRGAGPADPAEGYANYNLGYTLLQLGRCGEAKPYLQRAQALEPGRTEVHQALDQLAQCLTPAKHEKPKPPEHGKKPKHKGPH
jgi:tetratricopeptide (TPR) repeat protein